MRRANSAVETLRSVFVKSIATPISPLLPFRFTIFHALLINGAISSPFRGMAIGLNKVGDAISAPIDAVVDRVSYSLKDVSY
ncbi:hypothetical protein [Acinetobacter pittii]|uniref:hypothetical protein n=1 Tax=Acinetobacter pittii TaxID=48296 RepID=UPI001BC88F0A|nr:hypothetical protein [Acinetobacter pittii]